MPRKVFFSFHYVADNWRAAKIRSIGAIEGSQLLHDNDWEEVKKGGDAAIERWINAQIKGTSCGIVLIGAETAGRKWIDHEIKRCWSEGKGLFGIYIHNLLSRTLSTSIKGDNPFSKYTLNDGKIKFDTVVPSYDPPYVLSTDVYNYIARNMEDWVETAIRTRALYQ